MFTGIIECLGKISKIEQELDNYHIEIDSPITSELKIDQSVAHNGVCLTVIDIKDSKYTVTAIQETMLKTNLSDWKIGDEINLERCMKADGRFDGHIVQGHVDTTGKLIAVEDQNGSYLLTFGYKNTAYTTVEKGSITINGISLTVLNSQENQFSVALIPYTWEETNLKNLKLNDIINLEFDILGKYIQKYIQKQL